MKKLHAGTLGLAVAAGAVTAALPVTELRDVVQNPDIIDVPGHPADSARIRISFAAGPATPGWTKIAPPAPRASTHKWSLVNAW